MELEKTTTIRILSTTLRPTKEEAKVWGYDVVKEADKVRRAIGIVFQDQTLDDRLTGEENLDFHARLYGMKKELRRERMKQVLHLVVTKADQRISFLINLAQKYNLKVRRVDLHRPTLEGIIGNVIQPFSFFVFPD